MSEADFAPGKVVGPDDDEPNLTRSEADMLAAVAELAPGILATEEPWPTDVVEPNLTGHFGVISAGDELFEFA